MNQMSCELLCLFGGFVPYRQLELLTSEGPVPWVLLCTHLMFIYASQCYTSVSLIMREMIDNYGHGPLTFRIS